MTAHATRLPVALQIPSGIQLGIVCPMANEAESAAEFVDAVLAVCAGYQFSSVTFFVIVDTASHDNTLGVLELHQVGTPELRVIWAPETRGVADAYLRGYREALAAGCDWILEIDAGFSHMPSDICSFIDAMASEPDCVFGSRFMKGGQNFGTFRRRVISRGGTALTNALLGTDLTDMTSGFQLFTRPALEDVLAKGIRSKGPFFQTEIKTYCRNLRVAEIPIQYKAGSNNIGRRAIIESFVNLWALFRRRVTGDL